MVVLDTDISIELLRGKHPDLVRRLRTTAAREVGTTSITLAELRYGALRSQNPTKNLERVEIFCAPLTLLGFDQAAAVHFAEIKRDLATSGALIGAMDLLIAAITRSVGATLVTNNTREFTRVPSLDVENWLS